MKCIECGREHGYPERWQHEAVDGVFRCTKHSKKVSAGVLRVRAWREKNRDRYNAYMRKWRAR